MFLVTLIHSLTKLNIVLASEQVSKNPCLNGALCVPDYQRDTFQCICSHGYAEPLCRGMFYKFVENFFVKMLQESSSIPYSCAYT